MYLVLPILLGLVCMLPALPTPSSMETDYALLFSVREGLSRVTQALPAFIPSFLTEDYRKRSPPPSGATQWHPPLGWELVTLFRKGFVCLRGRAAQCSGLRAQGELLLIRPFLPSPHLFHPPTTSHSLLMAIASGFTGPAKPLAEVVAAVLILFATTHCAILP